MASSSRYVQLSQTVLLEYIYSDQNEINTVGNQWRLPTNVTPIWILGNEYTNQNQILNSDSSKLIEQGSYKDTGNVRDRSFAVIGSHRAALLDTNRTTFYNDFDPKITDTDNLPLIINIKSPVYDKVRVHMVQGFDFESNVGFVLSIKFKDNKGKDIVLSNFAFLKGDTWETLNPSAFFFGGRVYNTYVDFKILSLYNLIDDYYLRRETDGEFVDRITAGVGVKRNQFIQVYFSFVKEKTTLGGQDYIDLIDVKSIDLPIRDQFEKISAFIKESDVFDYVEYYATFGEDIIGPYITNLNNNGGEYMIIHELNISEYVYDASSGNQSWIFTDKFQNIQDGNFDKVNTFRPVIKNSSAISYKIDYTVRLFNKNDGSQVWKQSSMISKNVSKYGRKLKSINITENVVKAKIYNQSIVKEITVSKLPEKYISDTKYITSLFNITNVSVSSSTNSGANLIEDAPTNIYNNGLGIIHIPKSACFIQFNIYERFYDTYSLVNLTGYEDFIISFVDGTMEDFDIVDYPDPNIDKSKGQLIFKLSKEHTSKILSYSERTFTIYQKNELGEKTYLYSGKFYSTEEINKINELNKISELEENLNELNSKLSTSSLNILQQQNEINSLNTQIENLAKSNADLASKVAESDPTKAIELLKKENALLLSKLTTSNTNVTNSIIAKTKDDTLNQKKSQGRNDASELWTKVSNNTAGNNVVTKSSSSAQDILQQNNAGNIKNTNVSNFNPKNPSSSV